ncbi:hypothetical protein HUJ04_006904 [Dendroctonus ponderosae]|uniref:Chitin-binding type-2 domain-containing protein n=1 Tax=Dendroctonus ponderosae TaxID=77166 RepID=A0AAR5P7K0_DENPD|nr:hypothetical protein HUJ04_006904 [Dendroctonus ponderosae]
MVYIVRVTIQYIRHLESLDQLTFSILEEPKPSKGCPRANGFYRHDDPQVCDKFFNCVDGKPIELPCPPGLIYDDVASTCAWPESSGRQCTNSKRDSLDDGFSCPEGNVQGPDGRTLPHPTFAHPEDCDKFYICRNGVQPQKGYCANKTVYNEESFRCDDPANVPGCENYFSGNKN